MCDVPHARELHELSHRCAVARHRGDAGCRSRTRGRGAPDTGPASESHEGVSGTTRRRGERAADGMCKLSCAGELRELPYRSNSTSRCCNAKRCRGPRHERSLVACPTVEPYAGVPGRARSRSERAAEDVRDVPCALDMSRVPPAGRCAAVAVPRAEFSHAPSELSLRSRSELQRLSQSGAVLPDLPPTGRARRLRTNRHYRISRCISRLQPRPRTGSATEPRVVCVMPCRARLHRMPFCGGRWLAFQSARSKLRRGANEIEKPIRLHRLSRTRDTRSAMNPTTQ